MHRLARSSSLLPIAMVALASACTFNTSWLDRTVTTRAVPAAFDVLTLDTTPDAVLDGASLRITGGARTDAEAALHVVGLLGVRDDADAIVRGFTIDWTHVDAATFGVQVTATSSATERAWIDEVRVGLPSARDLVLRTDRGSIDVSGITGRVEAHAGSGSIAVHGAGVVDLSATSGSIEVSGAAGNAHATSGSIALDLAGWVDASADSGSIDGRIGGGGTLTTTSGSIDVVLTAPLDRDLVLTADSGSIRLVVPSGASMALDLAADSGSVSVDAGGAHHDGHAFNGLVRGGGFTVRARATSGSIDVVERGPS